MFLSIGAAAMLLGVSISTLRRWEKEGSFLANHRTCGGHRRYSKSQIKEYFGELSDTGQAAKAVCYARVSSHDQKKDLETQKAKLEDFAKKHFSEFELISDLGSGLNYKKPGLKRLLKLIQEEKFTHLILNHKDRLLRFGSEMVFSLCRQKSIEVIILEDSEEKSFEVELSCDVIELMTVFSARLYGRRSHQNRRRKAA